MDISLRLPLFETDAPRINWRQIGNRTYVDEALAHLDSKHIYRYCSIPEAISLLAENQTVFASPSCWPDKFESKLLKHLFQNAGPFSTRSVFAKCFSLEFGSDALWRLNRGSLGLLRLSFKTGALLESLNRCDQHDAELFVVRSRYLPQGKYLEALRKIKRAHDTSNRAAASALAMKREGFYFENELRICAIPSAAIGASHLALRFPSLLPSTILVDPALKPWEAKEVANLFERLGVTVPVKQSKFNH